MRKRSGSKKKLDSYIESVKARQRNLTWPYVLRGSRSVDEYLLKGARDAPLIQRVGAVVVALMFLTIALAVVAITIEQRKWFEGVFAILLFGVGGWLIRNALRK